MKIGKQEKRGKRVREQGEGPAIRPIPAFQEMKAELGYAAESGGAVHIALGNGGLHGEDAMASLAGLQVVESLAETAVAYGAPPIVTVGDPTLLPLAQDILRRVYERHDILELYNPNQVRFIAPSPLAYAAGAASVVSLEHVTTNMMAGAFGSEVAWIADAAAQRGLSQFGAVAAPAALGALYPAAEQLAIGEEVFAARAQITGERKYDIFLIVQDIVRILLAVAILLLAVVAFVSG